MTYKLRHAHYETQDPKDLTPEQLDACRRWNLDPARAAWLLTCDRATYRKPNDEPRPGQPRRRRG